MTRGNLLLPDLTKVQEEEESQEEKGGQKSRNSRKREKVPSERPLYCAGGWSGVQRSLEKKSPS